MSLPWFRMYTEFATDPKVQVMPFEWQRHLIMIFCLHASGELETFRGAKEEVLAWSFRMTPDELAKMKKVFIERGFISKDWTPKNWEKRQAATSNDRTTRYRNKLRDLGETPYGYSKHRAEVYERDGHQCVYCGSTDNLCLDHMIPVNLGGDSKPDNLACACKGCNSGKSGKTPEDAGYVFKSPEAKSRYDQAKGRTMSRMSRNGRDTIRDNGDTRHAHGTTELDLDRDRELENVAAASADAHPGEDAAKNQTEDGDPSLACIDEISEEIDRTWPDSNWSAHAYELAKHFLPHHVAYGFRKCIGFAYGGEHVNMKRIRGMIEWAQANKIGPDDGPRIEARIAPPSRAKTRPKTRRDELIDACDAKTAELKAKGILDEKGQLVEDDE